MGNSPLDLTASYACRAATLRGEPDEYCKNVLVDAVSVQDSSASLKRHEWEQVLESTTQVIDAIGVSFASDGKRLGSIARMADLEFENNVGLVRLG